MPIIFFDQETDEQPEATPEAPSSAPSPSELSRAASPGQIAPRMEAQIEANRAPEPVTDVRLGAPIFFDSPQQPPEELGLLEHLGNYGRALRGGAAATIGSSIQGARMGYEALERAQDVLRLSPLFFKQEPFMEEMERSRLMRFGEYLKRNYGIPEEALQSPGAELVGAIGSMGTFALSGFLGPVGPIVFGMAAGAGDLYDDAKAHGASDEEALAAATIGSIVGASEAAPIEILFSRLLRVPGGWKLIRKIAENSPKFGRTTVTLTPKSQWLKNLGRSGGRGVIVGLAEGTQEAFTQVMQNMTAKDFVGYDPDRDPLEGLRKAFTLGAGAGTITAYLAQLMMGSGAAKRLLKITRPDTAEPGAGAEPLTMPGVLNEATRDAETIVERGTTKGAVSLKKLKRMANDTSLPAGVREVAADLARQVADGTLEASELEAAAQTRLFPLEVNDFSPEPEFYYHGTVQAEQEINEHDWMPWTHFTRDPKVASVYFAEGAKTPVGPPVVYREEIDIRNPYRTTDGQQNPGSPERILLRMVEEGLISPEESLEIRDEYVEDRARYAGSNLDVPQTRFRAEFSNAWESVRQKLLEHGYDSIVYDNEVEGGGDTFILLDPARMIQTGRRKFAHQYTSPISIPQGMLGESSDAVLDRDSFGVVRGFNYLGVPHIEQARSALLESPTIDANKAKELMQRLVANRERYIEAERAREQAEGAVSREAEEIKDDIIKDLVANSGQKLNSALMYAADSASFTRLLDTWIDRMQTVAETAGTFGRQQQKARTKWPKMMLLEEMKSAAGKGSDTLRLRWGPDNSEALESMIEYAQEAFNTELVQSTYKGEARTWLEVEIPAAFGEPVVQTVGGGGRDIFDRIHKLYGDMGAKPPEGLQGDVDTYNRFLGTTLTLLQLANENPHIPGLQSYRANTEQWWNHKMLWTSRAEQRITEWRKLGKNGAQRVADFALAIAQESQARNARIEETELAERAQKAGLKEHEFAVYQEIDQDFLDVIDELESMLRSEINRQFDPSTQPTAHMRAISNLDEAMARLRDINYFPFSRFGNYYYIVRDEAGSVLYRQHFETKRAARRFAAEDKSKLPKGASAAVGRTIEEPFSFSGLPPQLETMMKRELHFDEQQQRIFSEILIQLSPAQSFSRHMLRRRGTPGFTRDALRAYADYFQRWSNHSARMKFYRPLRDSIQSVRDSARELENQSKESIKRNGITQWMEDHYDYIMNPRTEWSGIRAGAFLWYLGFLPKSAVVNLTQPALVTYPYLAARFGGDVNAVRELGRAYGSLGVDAAKLAGSKLERLLSRAHRDASEAFVHPTRVEPWLQEIMSRLQREGIIDESLAVEVAAAATGTFAESVIPTGKIGRTGRKIARAGTLPFHMAEKLNRRVTALAAARLAHQAIGKGRPWHLLNEEVHEQIFREAKVAVQKTQYEYARWNRPDFMRGRKSVVFMFWQYIQNTMYFALREKGKGRFWAMMLLTAGVQGLPFAENILDLLDALFTEFPEAKKFLGLGEEPMTDLRHDMREFLNDMTNDEFVTDLILNGGSRWYGLGPLHVAELAGVPVPNTDISGSLSLGRAVPGTEVVRGLSYGMDAGDAFLRGASDVGGAVANVPLMFFRALTASDPDTYKNIERAMPSALRSIFRATRWAVRGEETDRALATVREFDLSDPQAAAEIAFQSLGFAPSELNVEREAAWAAKEHAIFYEAQRRLLTASFYFAKDQQNSDLEDEVRAKIRRFNATVPRRELRLSPRTLTDSYFDRLRQQFVRERGVEPQRRYRGLTKAIRESYPNTEREEERERGPIIFDDSPVR